jgi:hypothetical protein
MQIQELINVAFMESTSTLLAPKETALIIFTPGQLMRYTEIIIKTAVEETVKSEGKLLDD